MADVLPGKGDFRERMRMVLRTAILDSARSRAAESDWASVRMVDIAEDVGVSRQTVYNEFGGKDDLARALIGAELQGLGQAIRDNALSARSFPAALRGALTDVFEVAESHDIVQRMVEDARHGTQASVLALLTWSSESLLVPAREFLVATFTERWQPDNRALAEATVDQVVRMVISEILVPSDRSRTRVIEDIVTMAVAVLGNDRLGAALERDNERTGE